MEVEEILLVRDVAFLLLLNGISDIDELHIGAFKGLLKLILAKNNGFQLATCFLLSLFM